jgi:hypothetical protein
MTSAARRRGKLRLRRIFSPQPYGQKAKLCTSLRKTP